MPSEKPFLSFVVDENLLRALDDYRFERRFASRSAAIRSLLEWALEQDPDPPAQPAGHDQ